MIRPGAWDFGFVAAPLFMPAFRKLGSVHVVFWFQTSWDAGRQFLQVDEDDLQAGCVSPT